MAVHVVDGGGAGFQRRAVGVKRCQAGGGGCQGADGRVPDLIEVLPEGRIIAVTLFAGQHGYASYGSGCVQRAFAMLV